MRAKPSMKTAAWPQAVAVLVGVLFLVLGVVGFAATGLSDVVGRTDGRLFGMAVNPLQNLVHLAFGLAGIALSARLDRARWFGAVLATGFALLFGYGVLVSRLPHLDVLNINWAGNWLHLVFAVVGLLIAIGPATPRPAPVSAERAEREQAQAQEQGQNDKATEPA
ncbi:MAG TPA: DUF4383 domain-containing protein [Pseudonocardiaceae bacterium]